MSTNIGAWRPNFRYKLSAFEGDRVVLFAGSSGLSNQTIIDSTKVTYAYNSAVTGTKYTIQEVVEEFTSNGYPSTVNIVSENTGIAGISSLNDTSFVSSGNFSIIGYYGVGDQRRTTNRIYLTNISGASQQSYTGLSGYFVDPINVSKHVLVVYNLNSTDSINLKTYYTGTRPHFSGANVLGISCETGELIPYTGLLANIRQPIVNYLTGVSGTKPIRYIVLMKDIPSRSLDVNNDSVQYQIYTAYKNLQLRSGDSYYTARDRFSLGQFQDDTALVTSINFGNYADCTGYIYKISQFQTGIYLSGRGFNTGYYFDDVSEHIYPSGYIYYGNLYQVLYVNPSVKYVYTGKYGSPLTTGNNLRGYMSWGTHADGGVTVKPTFAWDGSTKWGGTGNWYIMTTIESFNGTRWPGNFQGSYTGWFRPQSFGGANYSNIPVGAMTYVEEPGLAGVAGMTYFMLWEMGFPHAECAWSARETTKFACIGDPLVVK